MQTDDSDSLPANHPHFTPWRDPHSGVTTYVLTERVAPLQKPFYYVEPGITANGKWLWFMTAHPPSRQWSLAAVSMDPRKPAIRTFPGFVGIGNPMILPPGDVALVPMHNAIYRVSVDGSYSPVVKLPDQFRQNRFVYRIVTDLTRSCDGRTLLMDSHIGNRWLMWTADMKTGKTAALAWFGSDHMHSAFSKHDPSLFLVNQNHWVDPATGDKFEMNVRIWIMDTKLKRYEPLFGDLWFNHNCKSCHLSWWTGDGRLCWVDYEDGIYEATINPRKRRLAWKHYLLCHGQSDPANRYFCADENPYGWNPCRVWFYDRRKKRKTAIAYELPHPDIAPSMRRPYHAEPHPHFSPDGRYIMYLTTAFGHVDVGITPVKQLL